MRRRALLGATASALLALALGGCGFRGEYNLSWDEEVLLHDGEMIVVHVTRHFWRDFQLPTFQSFYILRDMEIAFDAGPPWGRYRRRFIGYSEIYMIDREGGSWYIGIAGDPGMHQMANPLYPCWILDADGKEHPAASADDIPGFARLNVLPFVGPEGLFFRLKGSLVKWDQKLSLWGANPRSGGDIPNRLLYTPSSGASK